MNGKMISGALEKVTSKWRVQIEKEMKGRPEVQEKRRVSMSAGYQYSRRVTVKQAAYDCMEAAYMEASAGGTLPAHARQVMYAARRTILANIRDKHGNPTGLGKNFDSQFTQYYLPDYMRDHGLTDTWDVVYDARGNLTEPHTEEIVPLGTLDVRRYLNGMSQIDADVTCLQISDAYPTSGPVNRFGAVLFIEKEGFRELIEAAHLRERYDIAIMPTKGMPTTAARSLAENMCSENNIPLLMLRDFDASGFSIAASFHKDTRRYEFSQSFDVVDLGIRLEDVEQWGLVSEDVFYQKNTDPRGNLRKSGATEEEIAFLCEGRKNVNGGFAWYGKRVELNAFASDKLIAWIESKLDEQGVEKVVPDAATLELAYARAIEVTVINQAITNAMKRAKKAAADLKVPKTLASMIRKRLEKYPRLPWDKIVAEVAAKNCGEGASDG